MTSEIKLIACDIDGTLLDSQHELSPRNADAIRAARMRGVRVILATGRARTAKSINLIETLGLVSPGIFMQGCMVHNADGSLRYQETIPLDTAARLITLAEEYDYTLMLYTGLDILTARRNAHTDRLLPYGEPVPLEVGSLAGQLGKVPFNKLLICHDIDQIPVVREVLNGAFNGRIQAVQTLPYALEILPPGVSKGAALEHIAADLGIPLAQTMALGDAENDVEMIRAAGVGVAMENAMPAVRAAANHITASNDADGVAQAIERFVLS